MCSAVSFVVAQVLGVGVVHVNLAVFGVQEVQGVASVGHLAFGVDHGFQGPADYTDVAAGPLAINSAADLYLYPNTVYAVKVNGAQIKDWLEAAAQRFNQRYPGEWHLRVARLHADAALATQLSVIQNELFDLGADLSRPGMERDAEAPYPVLRIIQTQVDRLETEIDAMNAALPALRSFILPGGSALAAHLHLCRTVARRAERRATELAAGGDANPVAVKYLNRLSDWLFVAGRVANENGARDVLWVPGASR